MVSLWRKFGTDDAGALAVFTAIAALPIAGTVVGSLGLYMQGTEMLAVRDVAATACSRAQSVFFQTATDTEKETAATEVLDRHLPTAGLDMATATYSVTQTNHGMIVAIDGELDLPVLVVGGNSRVSLSMDCDGGGGYAAGQILFFEGFETPSVLDSGYSDYYIEPNLPLWALTAGSGTQLLRNTSSLPPFEGGQMAELDGHPTRGALPGLSTNSAITTAVPLPTGSYRLSFAYHHHPQITDNSDQEIAVYIDPDNGSSLFGNQIHSADDGSGWITKVVEFDVDCAGVFRFSFAAKGDANRFGGFIDAIQLETLTAANAAAVDAASRGGSCASLNVTDLQ